MVEFSDVKRVYRHFLYLDGDEVLNALSGILGGEEADRLESVVNELGGNTGAKFSLLGVGVQFGAKGSRQTKRELRLRATIHSRVQRFLDEIEERHGVGKVESPAQLRAAYEGMLVEFRAYLHSLGGNQELIVASTPTRRERLLRLDPIEIAQRERVRALGGKSRVVTVVDVLGDGNGHATVALELRSEALLVERLDEFARAATIVGQVLWRAEPETDEILVRRSTPDADCLRVVARAQERSGQADEEDPLADTGQDSDAALPAWYLHPLKRRKLRKARTEIAARSPRVSLTPANADEDHDLFGQGEERTSIGVRPLIIFR